MDCLSFPFTFLKQSNFKNIMKYWSVLINLQKKFLRYVCLNYYLDSIYFITLVIEES